MTVIGIDLGTTYSAVAVVKDGKPVIITNGADRITPSVVAFEEDDNMLVGRTAKDQAALNSKNTIQSVKRLMGKTVEDVEAEDQKAANQGKKVMERAFEVVAGDNNRANIKVPNVKTIFTPETISGHILRHLKQAAEKYLGEPVTDAVITVPAYFTDAQRKATKAAGAMADLTVHNIVNEPTAAALAYGIDKGENQTILVFDLGGGTFDVTIVSIENADFKVLAHGGDSHLGGDDIDEIVMDWLASTGGENKESLLETGATRQTLRKAAEQAKRDLTEKKRTRVILPNLAMANSDRTINLDVTLTRTEFDARIKPVLEGLRAPVERVMQDKSLAWTDISEVVMVGGSSRIPAVQDFVKEMSGKNPHLGMHSDEAIALGAAVNAARVSPEPVEIAMPTQWGGIDISVGDVTAHSLSVELSDGRSSVLVARQTELPAEGEGTYFPSKDGLTEVLVHVCQGEEKMAKDNVSIGSVVLDEIAPAPKHETPLKITFKLARDAVLDVSALNTKSGKEVKSTIEGKVKLTTRQLEAGADSVDKYEEKYENA